jgi:hypothetical protein
MPLIMRGGLMGPRIGRPGLLGLAARTAVVAGTAGAVGHAMQRRQAQEQEQAQPVPAADLAATDRRLEQLKDLASLHAQGALTDAEFATQKAAVLGG